ncbi:glycosyltransferase [Actibacterium sp. MT2.3-13A]|uniref:glycosyltransferase family 2 protein n=1 Tax=Actibacterium sp. MT2.3-13A TaxID=2828332 RepID=UPI001BAAA18D
MTPWLSVLIPVHNGAATLERTLRSLQGQCGGVEIVLADQGSSDGSREIAESYSDTLPLRIIDTSDRTNWMANTNAALRAARAPYATILPQDDLWRPGRTDLLRMLARRYPQAAIWSHAACYVDAGARLSGRFGPAFGRRQRLVSGVEALSALIVQNTLAMPAVMFPREQALATGGLDETLWYTADWDLWLRLVGRGPLAWAPARAVAFRLHGDAQTITGSRDIADFRDQLTRVYDRHAPASSRLRQLAEVSIAVNVCLAGRYHNVPGACRGTIRQLAGLGPLGLWRYLRDSRLIARVLPRLRANLLRGRPPG